MASILSQLRAPVLFLALAFARISHAQSAGPNSPAAGADDASIGANAWSTPGNILTSNDTYATVAAKGISHYLVASDFGFAVPWGSVIVGIEAQVERRTNASHDVAILDGWTTGLNKVVSSAGVNRCLLVAYAQENGQDGRDITGITYGGRAMSQVAEQFAGTVGGFNARVEVWALMEADLLLASGTAIVPTYAAYTPLEFCEAFSSASFQHVDQIALVSNQQATGAATGSNPHQLATPLTVLAGSMAVNIVTSGNNTTPAISDGGTDTYTINSGFTEGTDLYFANTAAAPTSGACLQTAHKAIAANGTVQPSCTFNGSVNRWMMVGLTLQRARELDHRVLIVKGGVIGDADLSSPNAWPLTDAYATYGSSSELWGETWSAADINSPGFGLALSAMVQNGEAHVDHVQITVYTSYALPVELVAFRAVQDGEAVRLDWATATEHDNSHFIVQRSQDGQTFTDIGQVAGVGNSQLTVFYGMQDEHPLPGINYYRLVQVDNDGTRTPSFVVSVTLHTGGAVVYPNPTTDGTLTVYDGAAKSLDVTIYDNRMQLMRRATTNSGHATQLLHDLADGTYTVVVNNGEESSTTR
ncbi:MAG: T9SS type A sorting domain-containing protein, partial [Flavobacteriales bacterium]